MTKQILLSKDCFIDNAYLDEYVALINQSFSFKSGYTEQHHIIPVSYYVDHGFLNRHNIEAIALKDTANALVQLSYADHFYAHWLLYNCTTGKVKAASAKAVLTMSGNPDALDLSKEDVLKIKTQIKKDLEYYWSTEEDALLSKLYTDGISSEQIALQLAKTVAAVKARISRLNLSNRIWTDSEINWLKQNYKLGKKICANYLNRTEASIEHQITRLRISVRQWTAQDIAWLKANYTRYTKKELAKQLHRSESSIYNKLKNLGL